MSVAAAAPPHAGSGGFSSGSQSRPLSPSQPRPLSESPSRPLSRPLPWSCAEISSHSKSAASASSSQRSSPPRDVCESSTVAPGEAAHSWRSVAVSCGRLCTKAVMSAPRMTSREDGSSRNGGSGQPHSSSTAEQQSATPFAAAFRRSSGRSGARSVRCTLEAPHRAARMPHAPQPAPSSSTRLPRQWPTPVGKAAHGRCISSHRTTAATQTDDCMLSSAHVSPLLCSSVSVTPDGCSSSRAGMRCRSL
mmetsp:Transcript_6859/g.22013  ORF Transcript_6859/g.22013 Transcript_6859/m.22013 type:complete len:249 (-) Transcript_6859:87-833(-)